MKNKKVITLIMAAAASCSSVYAATLPTSEVDAYILAMNTMSPITAKYTIQYKQAVEQKCNTALSVEQLNSKAFTNVVQAMVSSETVDRMGLDAAGGSLQDTLSVIGKNVTCSDLNAPFKALLDDKDFTRKHQHLSKVLHTWNEVVSQSVSAVKSAYLPSLYCATFFAMGSSGTFQGSRASSFSRLSASPICAST